MERDELMKCALLRGFGGHVDVDTDAAVEVRELGSSVLLAPELDEYLPVVFRRDSTLGVPGG